MKIISKKTVLIFSAAFLITLLALAPAALLDVWVGSATHGAVSLAYPAGTIWSGSATPVLHFRQGAPMPLVRMDWDISFRGIFSGGLLLRLRESAAPSKPPAEILIGLRQVELRNFAIELPAAAMGELDPMLQAMRFQGQVLIAAGKLVLERDGKVTGNVAADWQGAGSALSPVNPFGNYRFDLAGQGDRVQISLGTVSGDLQLNGQGAWQSSGKLSFQAAASATGPGREMFTELLHHLGPETAPGVFSFKIGQ
ncbi:MAG TPA: type II secretion system protein N [Gallionellaceae bacterium]